MMCYYGSSGREWTRAVGRPSTWWEWAQVSVSHCVTFTNYFVHQHWKDVGICQVVVYLIARMAYVL